MNEEMQAEAAQAFSLAADAMVAACQKLEQCGIADPPIERLLQAVEAVTQQVHNMHPPAERIQFEPADLAVPGCRIAAAESAEQG